MATRLQNHEFPGGRGAHLFDVLPRNSTSNSIQITGTDHFSFGIFNQGIMAFGKFAREKNVPLSYGSRDHLSNRVDLYSIKYVGCCDEC